MTNSLLNQQIRANEFQNRLIAELNDRSYRAFNGERQPARGFANNITTLGRIPFDDNQPIDSITREMIKDYQEEQQRPSGLKDAFGEDLKYFPTAEDYALKPFTPINFSGMGRPATEADVSIMNEKFQDIAEDLKNTRLYLDETEKNLFDKKAEYAREPDIPTKRLLKREVDALKGRVNFLQRKIKNLTKDAEMTEGNIALMKKNIEENAIKKAEIDTENKKGIKNVEQALMMANRNKLYVEQGLDEEDADYLNRLKDIQTEKFDTILYQDKAELANIKKFKGYLKELIRRDDIIEDVAKFFDPKVIFEINKIFPKIKKAFLEKFGYDNKAVKAGDITDFIDEVLNPPPPVIIGTAPTSISSTPAPMTTPLTGRRPTGRITPPIGRKEIAVFSDGSESNIEWGILENCLYLHNVDEGTHIYFKIGSIADKASKRIRHCVFVSADDYRKNSFKEIKGNNFKKAVVDYLKMNPETKILIFRTSSKLEEIYNLLKDYGVSPVPTSEITTHSGGIFGFSGDYYGWGIHHDKEIPKYSKFGHCILLTQKLYYKNILSMKDKSLHSIEGLKNAKVSDKFVEIIMNIVSGKDVPKHIISSLSSVEKELYNQIIHISGLNKHLHHTGSDDIVKGLKNRMELIEGEIEAGNNNKELLVELRDVLMKLYHYGAISLISAKKYLQQF